MILSILDTNFLKKQRINYIIISLFTLSFSLIYEAFSHEVYSFYMIFAFTIPLILGACVTSILIIIKKNGVKRLLINIYNAGIATLTFGSLFKGVLEIYGTTNSKVYVYDIIGFLCVFFCIIFIINESIHKK